MRLLTRFLPYVLIVLFAFTTVAAVVTRPKDVSSATQQATLAEKINSACKPLPVNDWWIDPDEHSLVRVSCYDPKTSKLTYTVVDR